MNVGCAILGAGAGTRFRGDGSKLIVRIRGKALLAHAIDAASASLASRCSLILGAAFESVMARVDARRCAIIVNADWEDGIASSLRCAIAAHADDDGCILMLGDQPNVTPGDLNALIARFRASQDSIVALHSGKVWGAPVLFGRSDYADVMRLTGDAGAKRYAQTQGRRLLFVEASRPDTFDDVDRTADVVRQAPA